MPFDLVGERKATTPTKPRYLLLGAGSSVRPSGLIPVRRRLADTNGQVGQ